LLLFKLCDEATFSDDTKKLVANTQAQLQEAAQAALPATATQSATVQQVTEPNV
jgi:hypothetical protein